jgi:hypothetical protein
MAGLLDGWLANGDANMALAGGLLRGDFGGGVAAYGQAMQQQRQDAMRKQQFDLEMQAKRMAIEDAQRLRQKQGLLDTAALQSFRSPELANAMSQGPMLDGGAMPQVSSGFDKDAFLQRAYGIDPLKAVGLEQAWAKDTSPITVAPGASLVDRKTMKPVFTAPDKADKPPSSVQEYQFAVGQGYKGTFEQFQTAQKRAGASNTNISVNTEKSLLNDIAGGLGKGITEEKGRAQAAVSTISTVNRLMDALDSGKVMAGPATSFRQYGLQVGNVLGVTGKDAQEKLLNTRQAVQSLAQLELDAAQQMKGQGQITEAERSIIRRAASGDIDGMTTGELRLLGGVLDRSARAKIQGYNTQVKPLKSNPNAAALAPFLDVQEPSARTQPNVLRFDAQGNPVR